MCALALTLRAATTATTAPRPAKPRVAAAVWERAQQSDEIPVVIILAQQPQRVIMQAVEAMYGPGLRTAIQRTHPLSRQQVDTMTVGVRREAARQIAAAIAPSQERIAAQLERAGGRDLRRFTVINAIAARVPASLLPMLQADPAIASVDLDVRLAGELEISAPAFGATAFWDAGFTGAGDSVGVMDTGVRLDHPAFAGLEVKSTISLNVAEGQACFKDSSTDASDAQGHGSSVGGIMTSRGGSGADAAKLGVAYGVSTLYNLKVGFNCNGSSFSFYSDALGALNEVLQSAPVRIFNYSYGGAPTTDDDSISRSLDSLIDIYDLTITYSAGNAGPALTSMTSPATSYNGLGVANIDDRNTLSRSDDVVNSGSSRGPTLGGRKKPDIAAPGTQISSPNYNWRSGLTFSNWTGTSMAAPHVAAAAVLLHQAGVTGGLARKAILLNSTGEAQWASDQGWGYGDLSLAFARRNRYFTAAATAAAPALFYRGPDTSPDALTATLVWNRHVSGATSQLSNLDLFAYDAASGTLLASSTSAIDNVEKVSAATAAGVVLKVKSAVLATGLGSEPFALAVSAAGFVAAAPPDLQVSLASSTPVAGQQFTVSANVFNAGSLAAQNPTVVLAVPPGFTLVSGTNPQPIATIASGAWQSASWVLLAPAAAGTATLDVSAAGFAFDESFTGASRKTISIMAPAATTRPCPPSTSSKTTSGTPRRSPGSSSCAW